MYMFRRTNNWGGVCAHHKINYHDLQNASILLISTRFTYARFRHFQKLGSLFNDPLVIEQ